jgi:hypothetical protein
LIKSFFLAAGYHLSLVASPLAWDGMTAIGLASSLMTNAVSCAPVEDIADIHDDENGFEETAYN